MTISKSDYMLFLRHPAWLWLKKFGWRNDMGMTIDKIVSDIEENK